MLLGRTVLVAVVLFAPSAALAQRPIAPPARPVPRTVPWVRYGDAGTIHLGFGFGFGYSTFGSSYAGGVAFNYFVIDRVAPGVEVGVSGGKNLLTVFSTAATLRLLPLRTEFVDVIVIPRFGRLFLLDFEDFWAVGGTLGVIFWTGGRVGLQAGYQYERLFGGTCEDLRQGCNRHGASFGIVLGF